VLDKAIASRSKRLSGAFLALAFGLFAIAGSALASAPLTVKSYTGCLTTQGGTLTLIREGDSPSHTCPSGSVIAHFSGGDITGVTAGTGLTGGGTNGDITISLDPKYALRQDCANGQVVKWNVATTSWLCANDNDTTYSAGTGLALDGTQFSLDSDYRLPPSCDAGQSATMVLKAFSLDPVWGCQTNAYADQNCSSGKFANGIDSDGRLACATPGSGAAGSNGFVGKQINPTQGNAPDDHVGIPSDGALRTYASVSVPAGTYVVNAKGQIGSEHNAGCHGLNCFETTPVGVSCVLAGAGLDDEDHFSKAQLNDDGFDGTFALTGLATSMGGTLSLQCFAGVDYPGISIHWGRVTAARVG
jgi:hypothetical protein